MITYSADFNNLEKFMQYVREHAENEGFPPDDMLHIELAMEECIVNIINYAFPGGQGEITIECSPVTRGIEISVSDNGTAFNPLEKEDPDINLPVDEREVGGLGIFLVKNLMDDVFYSRVNDRNVLVMTKYKG
jgi:serine/threonine-protein kinase RsbW